MGFLRVFPKAKKISTRYKKNPIKYNEIPLGGGPCHVNEG